MAISHVPEARLRTRRQGPDTRTRMRPVRKQPGWRTAGHVGQALAFPAFGTALVVPNGKRTGVGCRASTTGKGRMKRRSETQNGESQQRVDKI